MEDYGQALGIDLFTVVCCIALLLRFGGLRFTHPATPYLVFHLHTVTARLGGLANGAKPLFGYHAMYLDPVSATELVRAALYCDIAFWIVTLVWIVVKANPAPVRLRPSVMKLDPRILRPILAVAFVGGIVGLRLAAQIPGIQAGPLAEPSGWSTSSYILILPSWFGLAVLGYAYYRGFGKVTVLLTVGYLILMSLQGSMRFRVILALLLAVQIWVERHDRRWPSRSIVLALAVSAALFFPMKQIGGVFQSGEDVGQVFDMASDSVVEVSQGAALDQMFLDEFAMGLTLMDLQGKLYFGSIYLPLITLPIPRFIWPDKPVLAGFLADISTRERPMAVNGMITTYLGEAYANFGIAGIFLVPPILAIGLALFHRAAHARPYDSIFRFSYALLSVNLIQIYRDGLQSVVLFTFVNMMPLVIIIVAHLAVSLFRRRDITFSSPTEPITLGEQAESPGVRDLLPH